VATATSVVTAMPGGLTRIVTSGSDFVAVGVAAAGAALSLGV